MSVFREKFAAGVHLGLMLLKYLDDPIAEFYLSLKAMGSGEPVENPQHFAGQVLREYGVAFAGIDRVGLRRERRFKSLKKPG